LGLLEDYEGVKKYEISEEDYKKRDNTFRKFKEEMKKKNPGIITEKKVISDSYQQELAENLSVLKLN
jgi:tubulin-specific chaperone B